MLAFRAIYTELRCAELRYVPPWTRPSRPGTPEPTGTPLGLHFCDFDGENTAEGERQETWRCTFKQPTIGLSIDAGPTQYGTVCPRYPDPTFSRKSTLRPRRRLTGGLFQKEGLSTPLPAQIRTQRPENPEIWSGIGMKKRKSPVQLGMLPAGFTWFLGLVGRS